MPRLLASEGGTDGVPNVTALAQLMEQRLPSRLAIQQHIDPALADLKRLRERLTNWKDDSGFAQEKMRRLLAHPWLDREPSWDAAEQAFLAARALNPANRARLESLVDLRIWPPNMTFVPRDFLKQLRLP